MLLAMSRKKLTCTKIITLRQQLTEVIRAIVALENLQRLTVAAARPPDTTVRAEAESASWFVAECERTTRLDLEASDRLAENPEAADEHSAPLRALVHQTRKDGLVARLELEKHRNLNRHGTDSRPIATPRLQLVPRRIAV
jgi:hypothetical protein